MKVHYQSDNIDLDLHSGLQKVGDLRKLLCEKYHLPSVTLIESGKILKDDELELTYLRNGVNSKVFAYRLW